MKPSQKRPKSSSASRRKENLDLSAEEEKEAEERSAPRAAVVYEAIRQEGQFELQRPLSAVAWSGLAAGLSMGFSMVTEGLLATHFPDAVWSQLFSKFGYSAGFLIVVLGRQQLFTENTLTVILPLLQKKDRGTLVHVLQLWAAVLLMNLAGTLVFAWVAAHGNLFTPGARQAFEELARETLSGGWFTIFLRAVFAGWLIAMMVWMLPAAESARIWVIIIMTYLISLGGYSHIIAGSVEGFYAVITDSADWSLFLGGWMLPTLMGNVIGGVSLVAVLAHVQISSEARGQR